MKKLFGLIVALMVFVPICAKEIPLKVSETDYGVEISNLDSKGKRVCKGTLNFDMQENIFVILKTNKDTFSTEKFAHEVVYSDSLSNLLILNGESFSAVNNEKKTQSDDLFSTLDSLVSSYNGILSNVDSILVISTKGKVSKCNAYSDGKKIQIKISEINNDPDSMIAKLIRDYNDEKDKTEAEKKADEERLAYRKKIDELKFKFTPEDLTTEVLSAQGLYKNDTYVYCMTSEGDLGILAYLGESTENLVIPEKIEGIPVTAIGSLYSVSDARIKNLTIPKTITKIADKSCVDLGIEKIIFAKDSKIEYIGKNAFRYNKIRELNLPKKKLTICFDAFSDNQIKKISIYKDWVFQYNTTANQFVLLNCQSQEENGVIKSDELEEVIFEEGCTFIVPKAFADCKNLKTLKLPASMRSFGACAFMNCTSLSDIYFEEVAIAKVEDYEDLAKKTEKAVRQYGYATGNATDIALAPYVAKVTQGLQRMSDPFSAIYSFTKCPIDLKTKRILLKMGLPPEAF